MFSLKKETDYTLQLLKILRQSKGKCVSLNEVFKQTGVSFLFLQKIARKLRLAKILKSVQGIDGGYKLNVDPKKISLKKIVEVIEGGCALCSCCAKGGCQCGDHGKCAIGKKVKSLNKKMLDLLDKVKLSDL